MSNLTPEVEVSETSLGVHSKELLQRNTRVAVTLVLDAFLFIVWVLTALVCEIVGEFARHYGVTDFCATAFVWCASFGTLLIAALRIYGDIRLEVVAVLKSHRERKS